MSSLVLLLGCGGDDGDGGDSSEAKACMSDAECDGGFCRRYQDVPLDPAMTCQAAPAEGAMHISGTLRDLVTREPLKGAAVRAVGGLGAVSNPRAAAALAQATTDDSGRVSMEGEVSGQRIGIVALSEPTGYFLTATGLASPLEDSTEYLPHNDIHDLWVVPESALNGWSAALEAEPAALDYLPLGEKGGIVGMVRDVATGEPLAGAVVSSLEADSEAVIRYVTADGTGVTEDGTSANGLFVILNPGLPEPFHAVVDGKVLEPNLGADARGTVFVLVLQ
jgi:hypothetical protein